MRRQSEVSSQPIASPDASLITPRDFLQKRYTDFRNMSRQELLGRLESWDSFDGPDVGRHMIQLDLRQQAAQWDHTALQRSTAESKKCMKAVHGTIATQQGELGKLEALWAGLVA